MACKYFEQTIVRDGVSLGVKTVCDYPVKTPDVMGWRIAELFEKCPEQFNKEWCKRNCKQNTGR